MLAAEQDLQKLLARYKKNDLGAASRGLRLKTALTQTNFRWQCPSRRGSNSNSRKTYARAAEALLHRREGQRNDRPQDAQPINVAGYVEQMGRELSPSVKRHLACIRMLSDWRVTGRMMRSTPAMVPTIGYAFN